MADDVAGTAGTVKGHARHAARHRLRQHHAESFIAGRHRTDGRGQILPHDLPRGGMQQEAFLQPCGPYLFPQHPSVLFRSEQLHLPFRKFTVRLFPGGQKRSVVFLGGNLADGNHPFFFSGRGCLRIKRQGIGNHLHIRHGPFLPVAGRQHHKTGEAFSQEPHQGEFQFHESGRFQAVRLNQPGNVAFIDHGAAAARQQEGNPEPLEAVVANGNDSRLGGAHRLPNAACPGLQPRGGISLHAHVMDVNAGPEVIKRLLSFFIQRQDMDFIPVPFRQQARPDGEHPFQPSRSGDAVGDIQKPSSHVRSMPPVSGFHYGCRSHASGIPQTGFPGARHPSAAGTGPARHLPRHSG